MILIIHELKKRKKIIAQTDGRSLEATHTETVIENPEMLHDGDTASSNKLRSENLSLYIHKTPAL